VCENQVPVTIIFQLPYFSGCSLPHFDLFIATARRVLPRIFPRLDATSHDYSYYTVRAEANTISIDTIITMPCHGQS
jgi:hypothetical protein